jgi:hypothetical protein
MQTQTKATAAPRRKLRLLSLPLAATVALSLALVGGILHYATSSHAAQAPISSAGQDGDRMPMMPAIGRVARVLSACDAATADQPPSDLSYTGIGDGAQVADGRVFYYLLKDHDDEDALPDACQQL